MSEGYSVTDINSMSESLREEAINLLFPEIEDQYPEQFVSIGQIKSLFRDNNKGKDRQGNYVIDKSTFANIFDEIVGIAYGVSFARFLAADEDAQCAWDDEQECFIYWDKSKGVETAIPVVMDSGVKDFDDDEDFDEDFDDELD